MIPAAASSALSDLFRPEFRSALWKTLGLTIAALIGLWFAISWGFATLALPVLEAWIPDLPEWTAWLGTFSGVLAGIALAAGLAFLIAPVSAVIAGLFLDDVADAVEKTHYPNEAPGRAMAIVPAVVHSLKFLGIVVLGNLFALMLLLIPGINLIAFFVVNGYLLGREYFEFAAMRILGEADGKELRRSHAGTVFAAGMILALFLAIPFLNLLTPLFAAAMMVHLARAITRRAGRQPGRRGA